MRHESCPLLFLSPLVVVFAAAAALAVIITNNKLKPGRNVAGHCNLHLLNLLQIDMVLCWHEQRSGSTFGPTLMAGKQCIAMYLALTAPFTHRFLAPHRLYPLHYTKAVERMIKNGLLRMPEESGCPCPDLYLAPRVVRPKHLLALLESEAPSLPIFLLQRTAVRLRRTA